MSDRRAVVVVGIDGSAESVDALAWAIDYAEPRGAVVRAVLAWAFPTTYGYVPDHGYPDMETEAEENLRAVVAKVEGGRRGRLEQIVIDDQPAGPALCELSATAELLVVGRRGHGGLRRALLGSVSRYCVNHARCPVVVVHRAP